ncbi:MAG: hypothetical protein KFF50_12245, partial [Desulfatitalea sp.]|nr:hypothetical protein [Desulfatitalea sp.]
WAVAAWSSGPMTAEEVLAMAPFKDHIDTLERGDIMMLGMPDMESRNELVVIMAVLVPASLESTVTTLQRQASDPNAPGMMAIHEIGDDLSASQIDALFRRLRFDVSEFSEVRRLMAIAPGNQHNFSSSEIALIREHAAAVPPGADVDAAAAMAAAMAAVLQQRYLAYRNQGLAGVTPYQVGPAQQAEPALELIAATESAVMVQERMPAYYGCLRHYPQCSAPRLVHQFFWNKQREDKRPLFVLKHWISDVQPAYALITERQYYLSHALSSLQVVIGCMPHRDGTLVVLLNQAFTDKVAIPIGRTIAKGIGRVQVEKRIRPMFERLRAAYAQ